MERTIARIRTKVLYILGVCLFSALFQLLVAWLPGLRHFYLFGFYPVFSRLWRTLTAWCPFSVGDILYILASLWLLTGVVRFVRDLLRVKRRKWAWLITLLRFGLIVIIAYTVFMVFWGMNYRYDRLYTDLKVRARPFYTSQIIHLCNTLADRLDRQHRLLAGNDSLPVTDFLTFSEIRARVPVNYSRISHKWPSLHYVFPSIKRSMFGYMMNYAGITGYFNPFTGEAQVNTTPMPAGLPFTACHEVAHQLGFAAEDDANFIGYLVAATSPDLHFRYAANFVMFLYGVHALSLHDPESADSLFETLITPGVKKDYDSYFSFYARYRTSLRPVLNDFYDRYLKANEQEKGIRSYNEVISLLIDYMKRYGEIPGEPGDGIFRKAGGGQLQVR